jgi:hypothetical protein
VKIVSYLQVFRQNFKVCTHLIFGSCNRSFVVGQLYHWKKEKHISKKKNSKALENYKGSKDRIKKLESGMVVHICNPSIGKAEGRASQV